MQHSLKMAGTLLLGLAFAFILSFSRASSLPAKVIYQFSEDIGTSWLEGLLVRDNGDLLMTTLTPTPSIYTLSRPWHAEPKITSNITLPNLTGALSLADIGQNRYAVAAANFTDKVYLADGTIEVWVLDLCEPEKPKHHRLVSMPEAGELNDMVVVKDSDGSTKILVADATKGRIWKVSMDTGAYSVWLDTSEMKPLSDGYPGPFGINGMRFGMDGHIYFSNTNTHTIWRIKTRADGSASPSDVESVLKVPGVRGLDSFAIDKHNRLWVASNFDNKLILVERHGSSWKSKVVLGGDTAHIVAGDTAVAFGQGKKEASMLYVVTGGAYASPVPPDDFTEPAKVVQVDVSSMM